jgi:Rps23 Pro-64 3,4-dihydroxylase Tpa1-like proline 4-hydroxylase
MKQIKINSDTILRFDEVLTNEECDIISDYMIKNTNFPIDNIDAVPWYQKNTKQNVLYFNEIPEGKIKEIIKKSRDIICKELEEKTGEKIYPHVTTIVLWKEGQFMNRHNDDGDIRKDPKENIFSHRHFTSVLYLNDDYTGGETYINNDGSLNPEWSSEVNNLKDFISRPKKGSCVTFYADRRNIHGVNKINSGTRIVISSWYTKDIEYKDPE